MGKGGKGEDTPAPKKHRSRSSREYSKRCAGPRERKAGQYVRYSKAVAGPHRQPPDPPAAKRARAGEERVAEEAPEPAEDARPAAAKEAAAAETGSGAMKTPATSMKLQKSRRNRLWWEVSKADGEIGATWENPSSGRYGSAWLRGGQGACEWC